MILSLSSAIIFAEDGSITSITAGFFQILTGKINRHIISGSRSFNSLKDSVQLKPEEPSMVLTVFYASNLAVKNTCYTSSSILCPEIYKYQSLLPLSNLF